MVSVDVRAEITAINPNKVSRPGAHFFLLNPDWGRAIVDKQIGLTARQLPCTRPFQARAELVVAVAESIAAGQIEASEGVGGRQKLMNPGEMLDTSGNGIKMVKFVVEAGDNKRPVFIGNEHEYKVVIKGWFHSLLNFGIYSSQKKIEVKPVFRKFADIEFGQMMRLVLAAASDPRSSVDLISAK